ncbi:MAG: hypothetical protein WCV85_01730 [Patescibacteria group bacterium]
MQKRITIPVVIICAMFLTTGIALAAPRDITSKIGGKANEVFKIVGGLITKSLQVDGNIQVNGNIYRGKRAGAGDKNPLTVADDLKVTGTITSAGLNVPATKRYAGTIDIAAAGEVVTESYTTGDCALLPVTYPKVQRFHWKKIAVPEAKVAAYPDIRMYVKASITAPVAPSVNPFTGVADLWMPAGSIYMSPGYVYYFFKAVQEACNGTLTPSYFTSGEYQIVVQ